MIQWIRDHLIRPPSPALVRAEQFQHDLGERVRRREREADATVEHERRRRSEGFLLDGMYGVGQVPRKESR